MNLKKKYILLLLCSLLLAICLTSCTKEKLDVIVSLPQEYEKATVHIAVPLHEGSSLVAIAIEKGYFEKYGIDARLTLYDEELTMAKFKADNRTLDISYVEDQYACNAMNLSGNQNSYVFFDNLRYSPQLLAQKDIFTDSNNNNIFEMEEIYEGLKGSTVYMDVGSSSGIWFWNLIDTINNSKENSNQLWIKCDVLLDDYVGKNDISENKVTVINYNNSLLSTGMSTSSENEISIAVTDIPMTIETLEENETVISILKNAFLPTLEISSGVWVASNDWLIEEPEVVQRVIFALYESALERSYDVEAAMRLAEDLCQMPINSFHSNTIKSPSKTDYEKWFSTKESLGYQYMNQLYLACNINQTAQESNKSFDESCSLSFFQEAIKTFP